jgi:hypothetical protein
MLSNRPSLRVFVLVFISALATSVTPILKAQNLRPPSRTMYKCKVNGTTTYSDTPCLGATRIEVEPTRGVSRLSGTQRIGSDVAREQWEEGLATALRPISGMDAKQYAVFGRRRQLPVSAQQECRQLDQALPVLEDEEKHAAQPALHNVQMRLFQMRRRFSNLHC